MSQPTAAQREVQKAEFVKMITEDITTRLDGEYTDEAIAVVIKALTDLEWIDTDKEIIDTWMKGAVEYGFTIERLENGKYICSTDCSHCNANFISYVEPKVIMTAHGLDVQCTLPTYCHTCVSRAKGGRLR